MSSEISLAVPTRAGSHASVTTCWSAAICPSAAFAACACANPTPSGGAHADSGPVRLSVEVGDDDARRPKVRDAGNTAEGGRGMLIVDALAVNWGVEQTPTSSGSRCRSSRNRMLSHLAVG